MVTRAYTLSHVATSPVLTDATPATFNTFDGQPEVFFKAAVVPLLLMSAMPGVMGEYEDVGGVGVAVPLLTVPAVAVWGVALEGISDSDGESAAIAFACAIFVLSDDLLSVKGLVKLTAAIWDTTPDTDGTNCDVEAPLATLPFAGLVVETASPEGVPSAG